MKKIVFASLLACLAASARAELPVGVFSHPEAKPAGRPLWTIKPVGAAYEITWHTEGQTSTGKLMTEKERQEYWNSEGDELYRDAQCIQSPEGVFCHITPKLRQAVSSLSEFRTFYFYGSRLFGRLEMSKVGPAQ